MGTWGSRKGFHGITRGATGGLAVFEAPCTFHKKILCGDRRYVTQNFDTKQAGRRIFEISVYRPGKFDAHTMTLRQDGGFSAERKMSQLATPQDLLPQDSLRAARNLLHNAHQSKANAICEPISLVQRRPQGKNKRAKESWPSQDSSLGHHP